MIIRALLLALLVVSGACRRSGLSSEVPLRQVVVERRDGWADILLHLELQERRAGVTGRFWITSDRIARDFVAKQYHCDAHAAAGPEEVWHCEPPPRHYPWGAVLQRLDSLGILSPPLPDPSPNAVCTDMSVFETRVERNGQPVRPMDREPCRPRSESRRRYDRGINSIISEIESLFRPSK